jgi:Zn finger protein HypA/HybF involved in hydrogenase expression
MWLLLIGILALIVFVICFCFWACCAVGANADAHISVAEGQTSRICPKCNNPLLWEEKDILVKFHNNDDIVVSCPCCNRMARIRQ